MSERFVPAALAPAGHHSDYENQRKPWRVYHHQRRATDCGSCCTAGVLHLVQPVRRQKPGILRRLRGDGRGALAGNDWPVAAVYPSAFVRCVRECSGAGCPVPDDDAGFALSLQCRHRCLRGKERLLCVPERVDYRKSAVAPVGFGHFFVCVWWIR